MKAETRLHQSMIRWLNANGFHAQKIPGTAFNRGMPDILAVKNGRAMFIEVKMPGKQATKLQQAILARWRDAGAICAVVTSLEQLQKLVEVIEWGRAA